MKIYRITLYLYLALAVVFLYDAYVKFQEGGNYWLSLFFVAMAIFMFFFRQRSIKKMEERNKNQH
ncbi:MAG TPA: hypothetical protein VKY32_03350 [Flavobacterium sp.]|nr:hypothetical protein [Flavobacterium sp.]